MKAPAFLEPSFVFLDGPHLGMHRAFADGGGESGDGVRIADSIDEHSAVIFVADESADSQRLSVLFYVIAETDTLDATVYAVGSRYQRVLWFTFAHAV
jgi:hypothetical protein